MSLITNNISGSSSNSSKIGVTGSVIFSNNSLNFPTFPDSNTRFFVSGSARDSLNKSVFGGDVVISGSSKIIGGISGSLTTLTDGTPYIIPGTNITTSTGSNGAVTINTTNLAPADATYLVLGTNATLANERALFISTGLTATDGGPGGFYTISVRNSVVATLTGSNFSGPLTGTIISANSGFSGSLTRLVDGTPYIIPGTNITTSTGSNGAITISSTGGGGSIPGSDNNVLTSDGAGGAAGEGNLNFTGTRLEITGSLSQGSASVKATGTGSHAEGNNTTASGTNSHAEGTSTTATGNYSHAEGLSTTASGGNSHAEGGSTTASGAGSHAEGSNTIAIGDYSHAEGSRTEASGSYSHAEGFSTATTGSYSHAEGYNTITIGTGSHAEGWYTTAFGNYSHAEGFYTISSGSYQTVVGKSNERGNNFSLFVVGNGTGNNDINRSDILRVNSSNVQITGSLIVSGSMSGPTTILVDTDAVIQSTLLYLANNT